MSEIVVGKTKVKVKTGDITSECTDAIVNLNNSTLNQNFGVSGSILAAAGKDVRKECARLGTIGNDEYAVTESGNLKCGKIIHLVDVTPSRIVNSVITALKACDEHKFTTVSLPAFGTGLADLDSKRSIKLIFKGLKEYLISTSTIISEITLVVNKQNVYQEYLLFFENYQPHGKDDITEKTEDCILRFRNLILNQTAINKYPKTWTNIEKKELQVIALKEESLEYQEVKTKFLSSTTLYRYEVEKIERIQNSRLFQSYSIKKQAVDEKNPRQKNVHHLYHGTSIDAISNIKQGGFNRSYCGKNATVHGAGTYFAANSSYSCNDTYSKPDDDGKKYIYQASVITGRYCEGQSDYKEPPHINGDDKEDRYDSVVDNVANPGMFVVFYDDYAYPEYLITLKPRSLSETMRSTCCIY